MHFRAFGNERCSFQRRPQIDLGSVFKLPLSDLKFGGFCRGNRGYFGAVRMYLGWCVGSTLQLRVRCAKKKGCILSECTALGFLLYARSARGDRSLSSGEPRIRQRYCELLTSAGGLAFALLCSAVAVAVAGAVVSTPRNGVVSLGCGCGCGFAPLFAPLCFAVPQFPRRGDPETCTPPKMTRACCP